MIGGGTSSKPGPCRKMGPDGVDLPLLSREKTDGKNNPEKRKTSLQGGLWIFDNEVNLK